MRPSSAVLVLATLCAVAQRAPAQAPSSARLGVTYTGDLVGVVRGGLDHGMVYLDNLDLTLSLDLGRLVGVSGATVFLYGLGNQGGRPSAYVGDAQGINNIEAPASWRLYEAWAEYRLPGGYAAVLAGLYDLNAEFDYRRTAQLFLHSSHGIGAAFGLSGRNGPSIFPVTSVGLRVRGLPARQVYLQGAVLDGVPGRPGDPGGTKIVFGAGDGALLVAEAGLMTTDAEAAGRSAEGRRGRAGRAGVDRYGAKIAVGAWCYTGEFTAVGGPPNATVTGSYGAYGFVEVPLSRAVAVFARAGLADERTNRFNGYTGGGLVWRGPVRGPENVVGMAVAVAHTSPRLPTRAKQETALELSYRAQVTRWLAGQVTVQHVLDPGADPSVADATALTVRVELSWQAPIDGIDTIPPPED